MDNETMYNEIFKIFDHNNYRYIREYVKYLDKNTLINKINLLFFDDKISYSY